MQPCSVAWKLGTGLRGFGAGELLLQPPPSTPRPKQGPSTDRGPRARPTRRGRAAPRLRRATATATALRTATAVWRLDTARGAALCSHKWQIVSMTQLIHSVREHARFPVAVLDGVLQQSTRLSLRVVSSARTHARPHKVRKVLSLSLSLSLCSVATKDQGPGKAKRGAATLRFKAPLYRLL